MRYSGRKCFTKYVRKRPEFWARTCHRTPPRKSAARREPSLSQDDLSATSTHGSAGVRVRAWTPTRQVHVRNASTPPQLWEPSKGPDVGSMRYYPREADSPGDQHVGAGVGRKQTIYNARQGAQGDADCRDQGVSDSCHLFISDVTTEPPARHRAPSSQCGEGNSRRVDCGSQVTRNFHVDCNIRSQRVPPGAGSLL